MNINPFLKYALLYILTIKKLQRGRFDGQAYSPMESP